VTAGEALAQREERIGSRLPRQPVVSGLGARIAIACSFEKSKEHSQRRPVGNQRRLPAPTALAERQAVAHGTGKQNLWASTGLGIPGNNVGVAQVCLEIYLRLERCYKLRQMKEEAKSEVPVKTSLTVDCRVTVHLGGVTGVA